MLDSLTMCTTSGKPSKVRTVDRLPIMAHRALPNDPERWYFCSGTRGEVTQFTRLNYEGSPFWHTYADQANAEIRGDFQAAYQLEGGICIGITLRTSEAIGTVSPQVTVIADSKNEKEGYLPPGLLEVGSVTSAVMTYNGIGVVSD
jgi:hypothetical protein